MSRRDTLVVIGCVVALFGLLVGSVTVGHRTDIRAAQWRDIARDQAAALRMLNRSCVVHPSGSAECPAGSFRIATTTTIKEN